MKKFSPLQIIKYTFQKKRPRTPKSVGPVAIATFATAVLIRCQAKFLTSEISDFAPCVHAQSNNLHIKYA